MGEGIEVPPRYLDLDGRCCGRKPLIYKRDKKRFCSRCNRAFDLTLPVQIPNWAWTLQENGNYLRNYAEDRVARKLKEKANGE